MQSKVFAAFMAVLMITSPVTVYADNFSLNEESYAVGEYTEDFCTPEYVEEAEDNSYIEENSCTEEEPVIGDEVLEEDPGLIEDGPVDEVYVRRIPEIDINSLEYGQDIGIIYERPSKYMTLVEAAQRLFSEDFYDFTDEEVYLMAQLAWHEAGCEGPVGEIAVVEIVLNRLYSDQFPNTVEEVINQPRQFTNSQNLKYITPSDELISLVWDVVRGHLSVLNDRDILFYRNPDICIGVPSDRVYNWGPFEYAGYVKHHAFYYGK